MVIIIIDTKNSPNMKRSDGETRKLLKLFEHPICHHDTTDHIFGRFTGARENNYGVHIYLSIDGRQNTQKRR